MPQTKAPKLSYLRTPEVCKPVNNLHGLYCQVLATRPALPEELLEFVRADVLAAGYDPDGRGMLGCGTEYGILARSYALWFYEQSALRASTVNFAAKLNFHDAVSHIQESLGQTDGGFASHWFSGTGFEQNWPSTSQAERVRILSEYARDEAEHMKEAHQ